MQKDGINNKNLGTYLKTLRESLGYTQTYVASKLHILQQTYSHYETGRITPPTRTLASLATLYGVPAGDLVRLATSTDTPDDPDEGYGEYMADPANAARLRLLTESEKRLIYNFSMLSDADKEDFIQFMEIRNRPGR